MYYTSALTQLQRNAIWEIGDLRAARNKVAEQLRGYLNDFRTYWHSLKESDGKTAPTFYKTTKNWTYSQYMNHMINHAINSQVLNGLGSTIKPTKENITEYIVELQDIVSQPMPSFVGDDGYSYCGMADAYCDKMDWYQSQIKLYKECLKFI